MDYARQVHGVLRGTIEIDVPKWRIPNFAVCDVPPFRDKHEVTVNVFAAS